MDLPEDDDFLYCDDCEQEFEGDCPKRGPLTIIPDKEVPLNTQDRALLTLPPQLVVNVSKIENAGNGVWSTALIEKRVRFGPYEGAITPPSNESGYAWVTTSPRVYFVPQVNGMEEK